MPSDAIEPAMPHLSGSDRRTLNALFHHPMPHNLEWRHVMSLFEAVGTVEERANAEFVLEFGGQTHVMRKPHHKDMTTDEVIELRKFAKHAGLSTERHGLPPAHEDPLAPALLVAIDHHEARVFQVDMASNDVSEQSIKPYDPHHFLHHLHHKDQDRERGQRSPEDITFYSRIAAAVAQGGRIVVVSNGTGESNAGDHLVTYLRTHHRDVYERIVHELVADLSKETPHELLALARKALQ